jgi:cytochrome c peroxidase
MKIIRYILAVVVLILSTGCDEGSNSSNSNDDKTPNSGPGSATDQHLRALIGANGLAGDASIGRAVPSVTSPKAQLGMKLFFTKALSLNFDAACASCHHPILGGGDALSLPIGVEAVDPDLVGPGRLHKPTAEGTYDGGPTVPRNSPTTFNAILFDKTQFWDSRIESLTGTPGKNGSDGAMIVPGDTDYNRIIVGYEFAANLPSAQANFPVVSGAEMRAYGHDNLGDKESVRVYLAERLSGANGNRDLDQASRDAWLASFRQGLGQPGASAETLITPKNIADTIGEYERSQLFVNNAWKAYVQGINCAISEQAKHGAILFYSSYEEGGVNCVQCHSGDFFTNESLYVMAVPQIGRGKNDDGTTQDYGRGNISRNPADNYKFRVPSLLNVAKMGPWGHDGAFTSLRSMVLQMAKPETAANYMPADNLTQTGIGIQCWDVATNTADALAQLQANRNAGVSPHRSVDLTPEQIDQIVAFLETLTDPCILNESCLSPWIPNPASHDFWLLQQLDAKFL